MNATASSSIVSSPPIEQCLENLKQSILQVLHHEQGSSELRSLITQLVQETLHRAEEVEALSYGVRSVKRDVREISTGGDPSHPDQQMAIPTQRYSPRFDSRDLGPPDQLTDTLQTEKIQVINPKTGKTVALSLDRVIEWARLRGIDQP